MGILDELIRSGRQDRRQDRRDIRGSEAEGLLDAELSEQRDRSNVMTLDEMREAVGSFGDLPGRTRIVRGDNPGTYRFEYEGIRNQSDLRIAPEALTYAEQVERAPGSRFRLDAPVPPMTAGDPPALSAQANPEVQALTRLANELNDVRTATTPQARATAADESISQMVGFVGRDDRVTIAEARRLTVGDRTIDIPAGQYSANSLGTMMARDLGLDAEDLEATRSAADRDRAATAGAVRPDPTVRPAPAPVNPDPAVRPDPAARRDPAVGAANATAIPAAAGAEATMYNGVDGPDGLRQGQVNAMQQLLINGGLDVGGSGGVPDGKWGRRSQAAFERLCREATPPINPAEIDFNDANDVTRVTQVATARAQAFQERRADFIRTMDPVIAGLSDDPTRGADGAPPNPTQVRDAGTVVAGPVPVRAGGIEGAQASALNELRGTLGAQESIAVENFLAQRTGSNEAPLSNRDGRVSEQELASAQRIIGNMSSIATLNEIRDQFRAAGVRDAQPVVAGDPPQGNRVVADTSRIQADSAALG